MAGEDLRVTAWSGETRAKAHLDWALELNGKWDDYADLVSDSEPSMDKTSEVSDEPETKFEDGHIRANDEFAFLNDLDLGEVEDGVLDDLGSGGSLDTIDSFQEG